MRVLSADGVCVRAHAIALQSESPAALVSGGGHQRRHHRDRGHQGSAHIEDADRHAV